ncbi:TniQ family protein [Stenotrophomonas maltophilia]|uniref:TniQ family protein n=1 Tax=Stenotrophomonas maltophilia TaxID=40324 RepID=UPI0012B07071|nr:hypothetical protein FEO86_00695 [Stenotrophomonas maltophilia]
MEPPRWTVLPPLELRDAGTPWTESLNGYANRLAKLSGISWCKLLQLIDTHSSEVPSRYIDQRRLDGLGPVSVRRARSLEKLTGQSLVGATLYGLSEIVSSRAASWSRHAAWCPICIGASDMDESATERLIWSFDAYSHWGSPPFSRTLTRRPIKAMRSVHVEAKEVQHRVQARCG